MGKKNFIALTVILLFISIFFTGCRSKQTLTTNARLTDKNKSELIADILDKELNYNTISGKVNLEILPASSKKTLKTAANLKIVKDEAIQFSIRPLLGVEAFRVTLRPDSVFIVDRLNKKYVEEDISQLVQLRGTHFSFYNLQALLTNSLFAPGEQAVAESNYKAFELNKTADNYLLRTTDKSRTLYNFAIDASDRIISTLIVSPDKNYTLQWTYQDFIQDGSYIYPTQMSANADINKKRFDIKISFNKLDINKSIEVDNPVSGKYEKVSLGNMLDALIK